ncbi:MAG: class I SAM-dependent methyltransferase [Verrucomicrobia bacterium]|nr:class I SAM-dependent methyltransferase [Verrucomicrobiota bacterium]
MLDLFAAAMAKRAALLAADTNALRLIDGSGDALPGIILEAYAGNRLLATATPAIPAALDAWLQQQVHPCYWKRLDSHHKASPSHHSGPELTAPFLIRENGLHFEISFQAGYSQGLFLDQRDNRAEVRRLLRPGHRLLNTFAYTGAFSVAAASAGAETTTLDLSQPCLDWAKRNFSHNSLDPTAHHFCKGDTGHWLRRFAKQGREFDAIILDPPTFSRDDQGKIFRVESDLGTLVALALAILAPAGWLLCCTNCHHLSAADFERQILSASRQRLHTRHAPMPADFTGVPYLKSIWVRT